jgi:hypothetical protein
MSKLLVEQVLFKKGLVANEFFQQQGHIQWLIQEALFRRSLSEKTYHACALYLSQ